MGPFDNKVEPLPRLAYAARANTSSLAFIVFVAFTVASALVLLSPTNHLSNLFTPIRYALTAVCTNQMVLICFAFSYVIANTQIHIWWRWRESHPRPSNLSVRIIEQDIYNNTFCWFCQALNGNFFALLKVSFSLFVYHA